MMTPVLTAYQTSVSVLFVVCCRLRVDKVNLSTDSAVIQLLATVVVS